MKFAIYSIACGEDYRRWAGHWADTFRTIGRYEGDIVVFSDGPIDNPTVDVRPVAPVWKEYWPDRPALNYCFARVPAGQALLDEGYDGLFHCDVDCLVVDPVNYLFDYAAEGKLLVFRDKQMCPAGDSIYHQGFLTLPERQDPFPSLSAGTFIGPASVLKDLFPEWRRICLQDNYGVLANPPNQDQAAFNAWCVRNQERCAVMPTLCIWAGGEMQTSVEHTCILHFCVPDKSIIDRKYAELVEMFNG